MGLTMLRRLQLPLQRWLLDGDWPQLPSTGQPTTGADEEHLHCWPGQPDSHLMVQIVKYSHPSCHRGFSQGCNLCEEEIFDYVTTFIGNSKLLNECSTICFDLAYDLAYLGGGVFT